MMQVPTPSLKNVLALLTLPVAIAATLWFVSGGAAGKSGNSVPDDLVEMLNRNDSAGADARIQQVFAGLVGKPFPDATLVDLKGRKRRVSEFRGERLLLFYAGGPAPGTTARLKEFEANQWKVEGSRLIVVAKTLDSVYATKAPFRDKVGFYEFERATLPEPLRYLIIYPSYFQLDANGVLIECQIGYLDKLTSSGAVAP